MAGRAGQVTATVAHLPTIRDSMKKGPSTSEISNQLPAAGKLASGLWLGSAGGLRAPGLLGETGRESHRRRMSFLALAPTSASRPVKPGIGWWRTGAFPEADGMIGYNTPATTRPGG